MKKNTFRFIDLFAGLGGFHLALSRLGGTCVFAAEWKDHLCDLYETNFGTRPAGDITRVDLKSVPEHDVLTAGFLFPQDGNHAVTLGHNPRCYVRDNSQHTGRLIIKHFIIELQHKSAIANENALDARQMILYLADRTPLRNVMKDPQ
ncbi:MULTISPECIES: DNA cytosine methyltransferase [unclassified Caballeronia]|uniref:DNA cytosine methyltransferase n=1 Tax=unclassified Caballeronia TaxID=2646786 RepID=UPI00285FF292|nr:MULTISPECIES: DNA cytosine methyltransferase [unclassified Caballeronia]MDR5753021.1 DNA cytosine methyltransferase [Caballeronia sp. LZ024]MDR5845081.1 DNA cytosine methyltransferase [Caballeronia sp. LZ031]